MFGYIKSKFILLPNLGFIDTSKKMDFLLGWKFMLSSIQKNIMVTITSNLLLEWKKIQT